MKLKKKESMYVSMFFFFFSQFQIRSGIGKSRGCLAPAILCMEGRMGWMRWERMVAWGLLEGA